MTRNQVLFEHLKNQAQSLFWQYEAKSKVLASPIAVAAYKSSFFEFLQFASRQFHLKKIIHIRKKHVVSYINYLKKRNNNDFTISKRVYAVCFWLGMIEEKPERFPNLESFRLEYPEIINPKVQN